MEKKTRGVLMLTASAFIWGTALVAQSMGMDHLGPFTFNALRFLIGGLMLLPIVLVAGRKRKCLGVQTPKGEWGLLLKGGACCGAIVFTSATLQQYGLTQTTVGKAGFISSLYIVIVPLFGLFFRKKVPVLTWCCIAVATGGMYLLCMTDGLSLGVGDTFVLLCAVSTAAHILTVGHLAPKVDGVRLTCIQFFTCSILSWSAAFLFEKVSLAAIWQSAVPVLYTGVLSCGVAYTFQALGQKEVSPVIASLLFSLESVFSVLAGWLVLGETLTPKEVVGCVLIFVAILAAQLPSMFQKPVDPVAQAVKEIADIER